MASTTSLGKDRLSLLQVFSILGKKDTMKKPSLQPSICSAVFLAADLYSMAYKDIQV